MHVALASSIHRSGNITSCFAVPRGCHLSPVVDRASSGSSSFTRFHAHPESDLARSVPPHRYEPFGPPKQRVSRLRSPVCTHDPVSMNSPISHYPATKYPAKYAPHRVHPEVASLSGDVTDSLTNIVSPWRSQTPQHPLLPGNAQYILAHRVPTTWIGRGGSLSLGSLQR